MVLVQCSLDEAQAGRRAKASVCRMQWLHAMDLRGVGPYATVDGAEPCDRWMRLSLQIVRSRAAFLNAGYSL